MRQLYQAFSEKEEAERLLNSLEALRQDDSVDQQSYDNLRAEYQALLVEAQAEIQKMKDQLKASLSSKEQELQNLRGELNTIDARFKVGQLTEQNSLRQRQRISTLITRKEKEISNLQNLIAANSSVEAGGPVGAPAREAPLTVLPKIGLPDSFSLGNISGPLRIAGLGVSVLMLIFVFLPWVSVEWYDISLSYKGMETVSTQEDKVREFNAGGIFVLLAAVLGIAVSVLAARPSIRGWGYIGTGILGIIGIVVFSVVFGTSYREASAQINEMGLGSLSFSPEISSFLYLLTILAILFIARLEFSQKQK